MKPLCILGSVILLVALLSGLNIGQRRLDKATVHIVVVDGGGRDLGEAKVDSFKNRADSWPQIIAPGQLVQDSSVSANALSKNLLGKGATLPPRTLPSAKVRQSHSQLSRSKISEIL